MQCPKCGESSADATVICPGCDFILDSSFLGDDILNEISGQHAPVRLSSGSDAIVFGALDEPVDLMFSESTGSFLTADTQDVDRQIIRAPVYVGKSVQELMKPEAVLAQAADIELRKAMLSPFEMHVLSSIDGKRPVARLRKKTGLSSDDLRIAVGMLAEKNAVVLVGTIAPPDMQRLLAGELDDDDDDDGNEEHGNEGHDDDELPATAPLGKSAGLARALAHEGATGDEAFDEATLEATAEDMKLPVLTKKSQELPKFKLDTMDIPDEPSGAAAAPSPWGPQGEARPPRPPAPRESAPQKPAPPAREPAAPMVNVPKRGIAVPASAAANLAAASKTEQAATFFELAHAELTKGNRVRAHVYAKLAVENDPSVPKYQELLKQWSVASRTSTSLESSLFADADIAEKQGNHHKALALMVQALDASTASRANAAHIHNRIGLLLATRFKKYAEASEHLMKACEQEPHNVVYKNNLGKIIALADSRSDRAMSGAPQEKGFLGRLKKALE